MNAKKCSEALKSALRKREIEKLRTYNLYAICFPKTKWRHSVYYGPYVAPNDECALNSFIAASKAQPELQRKNIYCVGTFNTVTGIIRGCKPRLVVNKISNKDNKNEKVQN